MTRRIAVAAAVLAVASSATLACAQRGAPPPESGREVFVKQGCYGCHTIGKFGTPIGPDLSRVGSKYEEEYLARWLRDPALQRPTAHMPKLELTEEEVRALAAFLAAQR